MKSDQSLIKEACSAYRRGNYLEASALAENIGRGSGGVWLKYLAALSSLHLSRLSEAVRLTEEIKRDHPDFSPAYQLSAYLNLKSASDREAAVSGYAAAIARHPRDSKLRRGMSLAASAPDFQAFQRSAKVADLTDAPSMKKIRGSFSSRGGSKFRGKRIIFRIVIIAGASAGAIAAAYAGYLLYTKGAVSQLIRPSVNNTAEVDMASIAGPERGLIEKISFKAVPEFYSSSEELYREYNRARALIKQGHMNGALLILNKIENSNASFSVKERVTFLQKFIAGIEERVYEKIDYRLISEKPWLYRGSALLCGGKVTNLSEKNNSYTFTLLLDYRAGDRFTAAAQAFCPAEVKGTENLKNGAVIEAEALFVSSIGRGDYYLTVKGVRGTSE